MKIFYTLKFEKEYRKLPNKVKDMAEKKEKIFRHNIFDKSLDTHKLHGKFKDFWSFSVNHDYRIIFEIDTKNKNILYFHSTGTHSVYK